MTHTHTHTQTHTQKKWKQVSLTRRQKRTGRPHAARVPGVCDPWLGTTSAVLLTRSLLSRIQRSKTTSSWGILYEKCGVNGVDVFVHKAVRPKRKTPTFVSPQPPSGAGALLNVHSHRNKKSSAAMEPEDWFLCSTEVLAAMFMNIKVTWNWEPNWFDILRRNCLLKHVIQGKTGGGIEVTKRQGRRRKHLLDGLKETRGCCYSEQQALDRILWRILFVRRNGVVEKQTTGWNWIGDTVDSID